MEKRQEQEGREADLLQGVGVWLTASKSAVTLVNSEGSTTRYRGIASAVKTHEMGVKVFVRDESVQEAYRRLNVLLLRERQWPRKLPRWYKKEKLGYYLKPSQRRRRRWLADQATKRGVPIRLQGNIPKKLSKRKSWPEGTCVYFR